MDVLKKNNKKKTTEQIDDCYSYVWKITKKEKSQTTKSNSMVLTVDFRTIFMV